MFEKSLQELVKGLRAAKSKDQNAFVAKAMQDIKEELKSRDMAIKAQALQKLTYLHMLGHDMRWAAFQVIEVMSQERFAYKRIAALAASLTFDESTDVIVLCTQLLKRDFTAHSQYEIGLAINTLSNIVTPDLGRDLLEDVTTMLTSARPYIRKKATLVLYKIYRKYPQALRLTFENLKRRLTDENSSVVSCAVNVVCELARKKPENYLVLAPDLFQILTSSHNNWMLIKVAKLMGSLVTKEPRLARKLLEPLANIVQTTSAKSLMYECIFTITQALLFTRRSDGSDAKNAPAVVRLCTDKLREFITDPDQNLKYLGLVGLVELMRSHPRVVAEHRELVLACLQDEDVTIRYRALELLTGMVTKRNLSDIVQRLLDHVDGSEGHYRDELISKIIFMCSREKYAYLQDFAWYMTVLVRLAYINSSHYATVAAQLLDVSVRVEDVRGYAVEQLLPLLTDPALANGASDDIGAILSAAAWVVGEYAHLIDSAMRQPLIDALLQPAAVRLAPAVQAVYVQCVAKVLACMAESIVQEEKMSHSSKFISFASTVAQRLHSFAQSSHVEVQERAVNVQQLLASLHIPFTPLETEAQKAADKAKREAELLALMEGNADSVQVEEEQTADIVEIASVLSSLFEDPLRAVHPKAQKKVAVPEGLDLDAWIDEEERELADKAQQSFLEQDQGQFSYTHISFAESYGAHHDDDVHSDGSEQQFYASSDEEDGLWKDLRRRGEAYSGDKSRRSRDRGADASNPWKLGSAPSAKAKQRRASGDTDGSVQRISLDDLGLASKSKRRHKKRSSKSKHGKKDVDTDDSDKELNTILPGAASNRGKAAVYSVAADEELPEGVGSEDSSDTDSEQNNQDALAQVDLSQPLGDDERMPSSNTPYNARAAGAQGGRGRRGRRAHGQKQEKSGDKKKKTKSEKVSKKKKTRRSETVESSSKPETGAPKTSKRVSSKTVEKSLPLHSPSTIILCDTKYFKVSARITDVTFTAESDAANARLHLTVANKSKKRTVDYVDINLPSGFASAAGLPAGATMGSIRIAQSLGPKSSKSVGGSSEASKQSSNVPITVENPFATYIAEGTIYYKFAKGSETLEEEVKLRVMAGHLLKPVVISQEKYAAVLKESSAQLYEASIRIGLKDKDFDQWVSSFGSIVQCSVIMKTPAVVLVYTQGAQHVHFTAAIKRDDAGSAINVTLRATQEHLPTTLAQEIQDQMMHEDL